jgi:hypothetical protein
VEARIQLLLAFAPHEDVWPLPGTNCFTPRDIDSVAGFKEGD